MQYVCNTTSTRRTNQMPAKQEKILSVPLSPRIRNELKKQAEENSRATGREGALIIEAAMRERIAKRKAAIT